MHRSRERVAAAFRGGECSSREAKDCMNRWSEYITDLIPTAINLRERPPTSITALKRAFYSFHLKPPKTDRRHEDSFGCDGRLGRKLSEIEFRAYGRTSRNFSRLKVLASM